MKHPNIFLGIFLALSLILPPVECGAVDDLVDICKLALENDPGFQARQSAFLASKEAKPQALAPMLPQLDLRSSYGLNLYVDKGALPPEEGELDRARQHYDTRTYGLNLRQTVIDLSQWAKLFQADAEVEQARSTFAAARQDLLIKAAKRYFEVLGAREQLTHLRSETEAISMGLESAKRSSELGLSKETNYLLGRARLYLARAREISAKGKLDNSREGLTELIGREPGPLARLAPRLPAMRPDPPDESYWTDKAIKRNSSLLAHLHAVEAAQGNLRAQLSGHLPVLSINAFHGYNDEPGGKTPGEDLSSSVALVLTMPLVSGGMVNSKVRQARHGLRQAQSAYAAQKRLVSRQVREALRQVLTTARWMEALQKALESNLVAAQRAQRAFEVGTIDMVSMLAAIRELSLTKRDYSKARHEHVLSWLELYRAVGTISEKHIRVVNGLLIHGIENKGPLASLPR